MIMLKHRHLYKSKHNRTDGVYTLHDRCSYAINSLLTHNSWATVVWLRHNVLAYGFRPAATASLEQLCSLKGGEDND